MREILKHAEAIELLAIDHSEPYVGFHGYVVRERITIQDKATRARLMASLDRGFKEFAISALCFDPHHGIRATWGSRQVDLVICFDCNNVEAYLDGKATPHQLDISDFPRQTFDDIIASGKKLAAEKK